MASSIDQTEPATASVPLADLTTGDLTQEQLTAWQTALQEHATELQVRLKTVGAKRALDSQPTLQAGLEALLGGAATSLQARYLYEENWWADTLLALPDGSVRLLRAALPALP